MSEPDREILNRLEAAVARIDSLEARVAHLESREDVAHVSKRENAPPDVPPIVPPVVPAVPAAESIRAARLAGLAAARETAAPSLERPPGIAPALPMAQKRQAASAGLEAAIGGRWFLVLGALIVVAGVGFFLKLAYDQGWIGAIPPSVRCLAAGGFGVALILVGLLTERRLGRFAGIGFVASGLAVVYGSMFAAYAYFSLLGPAVAFAGLALIAGVGLWLGVRSASLLLAVLSLVGAYLAPIMLARPESPDWALPPYLIVLMMSGSVLAMRERLYRPLAALVWWGTVLLGGAWIVDRGPAIAWLGLGFVGAFWVLAHVARLRLAAREERRAQVQAALASLSSTLWAVGAVWILAWETSLAAMWLVPAGGSMAALLGGMMLSGSVAAFRDRPQTTAEAVGASLWCQAGALLPVAILVGVDRAWSQILIWMVLGVGAAAASRWIRSTPFAWYAAVLMSIGTLRTLAEAGGGLHAASWVGYGLVASWWMGMMLMSGLAWACAAEFMRRPVEQDEISRPLSLKLVVAGALMASWLTLTLSVIHEDMTPDGALLAYLALASLAAGFGVGARRGDAVLACAGWAVLGMVVWGVAYFGPDWYLNRGEHPLLMHPGLLWSVWIALIWLTAHAGAARWCRMKEIRAHWGGVAMAVLVLLVATSFEVARAAGQMTSDTTMRSGSVSVWWAIVACAFLLVGFVRRMATARYAGIALLLAATGKLLTWDLSQVSPAVRVACFIAIGLVLLGVAAQYLRTAGARSRGGADADRSP